MDRALITGMSLSSAAKLGKNFAAVSCTQPWSEFVTINLFPRCLAHCNARTAAREHAASCSDCTRSRRQFSLSPLLQRDALGILRQPFRARSVVGRSVSSQSKITSELPCMANKADLTHSHKGSPTHMELRQALRAEGSSLAALWTSVASAAHADPTIIAVLIDTS